MFYLPVYKNVGTGWTDPIPTLYGFGVNRLIYLRLLYCRKMISYLICCSAGTQILPIVIIRYVVRSNFFERNPEDESGLVNFEVGVCVKSIAVDQVQCSCD